MAHFKENPLIDIIPPFRSEPDGRRLIFPSFSSLFPFFFYLYIFYFFVSGNKNVIEIHFLRLTRGHAAHSAYQYTYICIYVCARVWTSTLCYLPKRRPTRRKIIIFHAQSLAVRRQVQKANTLETGPDRRDRFRTVSARHPRR